MDTKDKDFIPSNWDVKGSIIKVIGVGGGGNNAVNNMFRTGIEGVDFVLCNTDSQALNTSPIATKVQLGSLLTRGRGAGCNPEQGKQAAIESLDTLEKLLSDGTEMIFITAGMGGGTGTGAAPVIAKLAREMNLLTVAIVTLPFHDEGRDFMRRAREGIAELQCHVDSLLVIDNQRLYEIYGELPIIKAFAKVDDVLTTAAKGIAEIITRHGYVNVDFADVRKVMTESGVAIMGTGSASGPGRALAAAEGALSSPLLNNSDISGAKNVLVNITASEDVLMTELNQIMTVIQERTGGGVEFIKRGVVFDNSLGDTMNVTVVATGFGVQTIPIPLDTDLFGSEQNLERIPLEDPFQDSATEEEGFPKKKIFTIDKEEREQENEPSFEVHDRRRVFTVKDVEETEEVSVELSTAEQQVAATPVQRIKLQGRPVLRPENEEDILELENTPAYMRKHKQLNTSATRNVMTGRTASSSRLTRSVLGDYSLSIGNPYVDKQVD
ncbi:MAG: cell division protein FtsZ [Bacteroidales bacterium]|nr:cell division protein FtsZ [Bacteroidales bacterium]